MPLNPLERKIVAAGAVLAVIMGLFPPWATTSFRCERPHGYCFIATPPDPEHGGVHVDVTRLGIQLGVVWACVGVGLLFTGEPREQRSPQE